MRGIDTVEALENMGSRVGIDAGAGVHTPPGVFRATRQRESAAGGVFDGVVEQAEQQVLEPAAIARPSA
jgi:hypothetical protein